MNRRQIAAAASIILGTAALFVGNAGAVDLRDLAAIARSEKAVFDLDTPNTSERLADKCRSAIVQLDGHLNAFDEKDRGEWRQALRWTELVAEMGRDNPAHSAGLV